MQGIAVVATLIVMWIALVAADRPPDRKFDLNAPGALETLRRSRPDHFGKVRQILESVSRQPDKEVARWIRVSFGAHSVVYPLAVRTSYPPQRRLSFVLDDTRYDGWIWLTDRPFQFSPAGVPTSTGP